MFLLFDNPKAMLHHTPAGHPEQVARISSIKSALEARPIDGISYLQAEAASHDVPLLAHPKEYVEQILALSGKSGSLDGDTFVSPDSVDAALIGVGAAIEAVKRAITTRQKSFILSRPPGHHAERNQAMGFCLFGNAALAAKYAIKMHGLKRVAVVDFDVHHGNGTQDILWDEEHTLFISTHQYPLYPGTGAAHEKGAHGNVMNFPLAPGTGSQEMRAIYDTHIFPALIKYEPELIIVSAGFDAHENDPLANLNWKTEDFAWLGSRLSEIADQVSDGRLVSTLEGGYDLEALSDSVHAYITAQIGA